MYLLVFFKLHVYSDFYWAPTLTTLGGIVKVVRVEVSIPNGRIKSSSVAQSGDVLQDMFLRIPSRFERGLFVCMK